MASKFDGKQKSMFKPTSKLPKNKYTKKRYQTAEQRANSKKYANGG